MNKNEQNKPKLVLAGLGALIVLELLAAWMVVAVYVRRDDGLLVRRTAGFLPVAKIGSYTVSYNQFVFTRDAIKHFLNSPTVKSAGQAQPMTPLIEKSAYERLVREAAVKELAAERKVQVTDGDVDKAYGEFMVQASSSVPDVSKYIRETFDWDEREYRANVVRPQLLEEKLVATYATDTDPTAQFETYLAERLQKPDVKRYLEFPTN